MSKDKWSRGDIVELVALLVGIPAAIGAIIMLAAYFRRRRLGLHGEQSSCHRWTEVEAPAQEYERCRPGDDSI